jgi:NADPH-dependent glutamate synthase beta subunit-like oxidoreductase
LNIPGEDATGVMTGVDFLREVNLGNKIEMSGTTIVIGGGNVAIDVARTAVRCGSDRVEMFCLEGREEMPALDEEVDEAIEEGIHMNHGWGPTKVLVENNKVVGIEFKKCVSVFDEEGKFNPKFNNNEIIYIKADHILTSVGQVISWGDLVKDTNVIIRPNNTIEVDGYTLQTGEGDIFAGGDAATGPKFAIDAIALGKEAAISIHRYVQPGQSLVIGRDRREFKAFNKETLKIEGYDNTPRQRVAHVKGREAKESFKDLRGTFTEEQVKKETERCLGCGATSVDEYICVGCGACTTKCKFDAISLVRKYDATSVEIEDLKKVVIKNAMKRKGKILTRKITKTFIK